MYVLNCFIYDNRTLPALHCKFHPFLFYSDFELPIFFFSFLALYWPLSEEVSLFGYDLVFAWQTLHIFFSVGDVGFYNFFLRVLNVFVSEVLIFPLLDIKRKFNWSIFHQFSQVMTYQYFGFGSRSLLSLT